jgi:elongation factor P
MATTNDLKNGMTLNLDGQLWNVIEFQHVKPGKGGAFVRTKMRSVLSGKVVEKTFNAGVKVEVASVEKRNMSYLYKDGDDFMFMAVVVAMHEGNPLFIELPASVTLKITYTEPGIQGDRSSGGTKPATVETGITIQVPLFIKQDEMVLVDTRTGEYLGRAN